MPRSWSIRSVWSQRAVPVQGAVIAFAAYGISLAHFEDVDPFVPVIISLTVFGVGCAVMLAIVAALHNPDRRRRLRGAGAD